MDWVAQQLVALQARRQPPRLVRPLVAQRQVDVAAGQRRQRLLRFRLDELSGLALLAPEHKPLVVELRDRRPVRDRDDRGMRQLLLQRPVEMRLRVRVETRRRFVE